MIKKISELNKYVFYIVLIAMLFSPISQAKIFKWVDSNGRTHYSDTDLSVGNTKVEALTVALPNITVGHTYKPEPLLRKESSGQDSRLAQKQLKKKKSKASKVDWGGEGPETDQKRCALAQDILNGAAKHSNGAPVDAHDIKVAQRDVRKFCQ